jgi:hypothetical protein
MSNFEKIIIIIAIISLGIVAVKFSQPIPIKTKQQKIEERIKRIINNNETIYL